MHHSFERNWQFQENYTEAIKMITLENAVEFVSVRTGTEKEDKQQSTDFVVSLKDGTDMAVRIRRPSCDFRDLTIRTRNKGFKTEIHKLNEGYGSHYLYCWTGPDAKINEYILVNLDALRLSGLISGTYHEYDNKDGTGFLSINIRKLKQARCLIRHWESNAVPEIKQPINQAPVYSLAEVLERQRYENKIRRELGEAYRNAIDNQE